MLLTSSDLPSLKENLLYCEKDSGIYTTVGVHPLWCNVFEKNEKNLSPEQYIEEMKEAYEQNKSKIIAFGEIGLDYDSKRLNYCSIELQKKYLELQLKLAKQLDLPLFLHARDNNACSDLFKIIKKIYHSTNEKKLFNGVVHSFTSDAQDAEIILENGCYIGLNGL
ncbi:MAG: TatD DNase [Paramarteilia canceri]